MRARWNLKSRKEFEKASACGSPGQGGAGAGQAPAGDLYLELRFQRDPL